MVSLPKVHPTPTPNDSIHRMSARQLASAIARRELSALEVVEAHIARIDRVDGRLHAMVWRRFDEARREAREVDEAVFAGRPLGPLAGVPITLKECLDLAGSPSTFGVPSRRSHVAAADEVHVARLRAAGAVVLGKTNVAQLLAFVETDNPLFGRTDNPWDPTRSPGGSSGGEAALLAAGGSALGVGTDIGGSARVPASFSGVVGFKPSAGRLPDEGTGSFPRGQRAIQSQVGLLGRTVGDVALGLSIASGALAPPRTPAVPFGDPASVDVKRLRVGVFTDDGVFAPAAACVRAVRVAAEALARRGVTLVELTPPAPAEAFELFYRMLSADQFEGGRRTLGRGRRDPHVAQIEQSARTPALLLPLVKMALRLSGRRRTVEVIDSFGPYHADGYFQAVERLLDYRARFTAALDGAEGGALDAVLSPATGLPAVRHGATLEVGLMGSYTLLWNVLGWPAGVVPVSRVRPEEETATVRGDDVRDRTAAKSELGSAGLPVAAQIAARPFEDHVALALLGAIEEERASAADYPRSPPP